MSQLFTCQICYTAFDGQSRKPMMLCLNQHMICQECLQNLPRQQCPFCKQNFRKAQIKPFRLVIDKIKQPKQIKKKVVEYEEVRQNLVPKAEDIRQPKEQRCKQCCKCNCNFNCEPCQCCNQVSLKSFCKFLGQIFKTGQVLILVILGSFTLSSYLLFNEMSYTIIYLSMLIFIVGFAIPIAVLVVFKRYIKWKLFVCCNDN